mgnify:CR=1 FL=1
MPRIENITRIYSPYLGYTWRIYDPQHRIDSICSANQYASGDPYDTSIRCCDAVLGCVGDPDAPRFYRDLEELLAILPPVIERIDIMNQDGDVVKRFYRVKNIYSSRT